MSEKIDRKNNFTPCCDLEDVPSPPENAPETLHNDEVLLERGGFFRCPPVKSVTPSIIRPNYEYVEILASGKIFFQEDGEEEKEYTRGTIFWHSAGEKTICHTDPKDPYRCYVLVFRVPTGWKRHSPRVSYWGNDEAVLNFASECVEAVRESTNKELLSRYAYSTLEWKAFSFKGRNIAHLYPLPLQKALEFASKNASSSLSVEMLAHVAGVSRATLFTLFRTHLGMPPHSYLLEKKMEKAKDLLAGEIIPIKEVVEKCGFESIEVFYRCFRRICGVTPAQYRKRYSVYPDKIS